MNVLDLFLFKLEKKCDYYLLQCLNTRQEQQQHIESCQLGIGFSCNPIATIIFQI